MIDEGAGGLTLVFTDIEGSTTLVRELGSSYGLALRVHRSMIERCFAAQAGTEVADEGDGLFFAFPSASRAVAAAVAAQLKIEGHPWPDGIRLRVRMGLHAGEVKVSGGTYVGLTVHEASRIANAAHGGQILCSAAVANALGGAPPAVRLRDLGEYVLRGFADARHLFQVDAEGLQQNFPLPRGCLRAGGTLLSIWFRDAAAGTVLADAEGPPLAIRPLNEGVEVEIEPSALGGAAFRLVVRSKRVIVEEYDGLTVGGVTDAATVVNALSRLIRIDDV